MKKLFILPLVILAIQVLHADTFRTLFRPGKDRALFFAVNEYKHFPALKNETSNPIKGAFELAAILQNEFGFDTEVVKNPTLDQINEKIAYYDSQYKSGVWDASGQLLIFFSGHGVVQTENGYFAAADTDPSVIKIKTTGYSYEVNRADLSLIGCKHILVAIDACYSGTFDPDWFDLKRTDPNIKKRPGGELTEGQKLVANHEQRKTRMFFTSATEVKSPEESKFAKNMYEGFLYGSTPENKDGILTSTELFAYIEKASPTPYRGEFKGDEAGSSFLFFWKGYKETDTDVCSRLIADLGSWQLAKTQHSIVGYQKYQNDLPEGVFREMAEWEVGQLAQVALQRDATKEKTSWKDLGNPLLAKLVLKRLCELGFYDPRFEGNETTPFKPVCDPVGTFDGPARMALLEYCKSTGISYDTVQIYANLQSVLLNDNAALPTIVMEAEAGDTPDTRLAKKVLRAFRAKGYWIARSPEMMNIVYVQGLDSSGVANDNALDGWNDRRLVIRISANGTPVLEQNHLCTTEPGIYYTLNPLNPLGAAHLAPGQYKAWTVGLHKGRDPALVHRGFLRFYRDKNKNGLIDAKDILEVSNFNGLNQHGLKSGYKPDKIGQLGSGALIGYNFDEQSQFLNLVKQDIRYKTDENYIFISTLLLAEDLK